MASVDGSRSLQGASDEFYASICGPCKNVGLDKGANHYCKDCAIYICDHCKDHHLKFPLTLNHVIVSGGQVPAVTSTRGRPTIVIFCSCNKNQEVKHYCDDHKDTLCDSCKHSKHYKCKVSSLQDKGRGYSQPRMGGIMSKIKSLEDDYDQLKQTRNDDSRELQRSVKYCGKGIDAWRKDLNDFFDDLEKSMKKQLKFQEDDGQKRISQHISTLTATSKMLETDYKLLQDAKTNGGSALMFAADVQVSKGIKDYEDTLTDIANDAVKTNVKFEKNAKLVKLQADIDSLGSLIIYSARDIQGGRKLLLDSKIQSQQKQMNVKMSDDKNTPCITGTVVRATGEIILCDYTNYKLKLLDSSNALKDSLKLNAQPRDVSVVDAKTVIVTLPWNQQLQYIDVLPRLTPERVLKLNKKCWGVRVTGDKIFTTCHNQPGEGEIRILDMDGNLLQQLGINQDGSFMFTAPCYITVSPAEKKIFVSDYGKDTVTCMTMDNRVIYQYRDNGMKWPRGLYCDGGDNILVCGGVSNNVQVITTEGKKHCDLVSSRDVLEKPVSISYRESDDTLIVGCFDSNNAILYKLGK